MLYMIPGRQARRYPEIMDGAYRLRHRIFVEKMGWSALRKPDGREIDQFDTEDALNFVGWEDGAVYCYSRLLPTTKPHLLSEVYPEILDGAEVPSGPDIYEWTRTCVAPERRDSKMGIDRTARMLFTGVAEACVQLGIRALTVETDPLWITRFLELGWRARPLALPRNYDGEPLVPIFVEVDEHTVERCRALLGTSEPVLRLRDGPERNFELPPLSADAPR